jgi:hypothetical protein
MKPWWCLHLYHIWDCTKKREAKTKTAEMKYLWRAAGYTRKNQIRNTKIREKFNTFNLNNKTLKSGSR